MTIREVLKADWNVDKIDVTVRDSGTTEYIMQYVIGRDVVSGRSERFAYEAECGDMYDNCGKKKLYINRIIQFHQLADKPQEKGMCHGVLLKEIPKELLELTIDYMVPYDYGWSNNLYGYRFTCAVDSWPGIPGETKQIKFDIQN